MREYLELLKEAPFQLVSLDDLGVTAEVEETGETFRENAVLKATTYAAMGGMLALADDSGLEVDALGGEPGVRSARYGEKSPQPAFPKGGQEAIPEPALGKMSAQDRVALLLRNLAGVPWDRRTARFRCVICIAGPPAAITDPSSQPFDSGKVPLRPPLQKGGWGDSTTVEGAVAGMVQYKPQGAEGFGYDPVFFLPSYGQTMAQLSLAEKNLISHRADAARKAVDALKKLSAGSIQPQGNS